MFKIGLLVYTYTYIHCVEFGDSQIFGGDKSGSLEFRQQNGTQGTVCDNDFDSNDALVACQQLGYDNGKENCYITE